MKRKFTYLLLLTIFCHAQTLLAQNAYRSIASGNWGDQTTWETLSGGTWIPATAAPTSADGVITIQSPNTVTVAATVTADQVVIASGGTLTANAAFTIADGTGTDLDVQSGGTLNIGAALNITGVWNNAGAINWSAGNISFTNGTLNNNATITITGNTDMLPVSGTNVLNNNAGAVITKSAGTGNTTINVTLNNAGTINVNSGIIINTLGSSAPAVLNTGTINVAAGSVFSVPFGTPVTLNAGTAVTGSGTFRVNGATSVNLGLTIPSTMTYDSGGEITGSGSITLEGTMNWSNNPIRVPLTISAGATLNSSGTVNRPFSANMINNGTFNWDANADLIISNSASITNNGTFNWKATANKQLRSSGGTFAFTNNGIFSKTEAGTTLDFPSITFTNSSTGTLQGVGSITFTGTGTLTNNGTIAPGNSPGSLTINSSAITSTSTVEIEINAAGGPTTPGTGFDRLTLSGSTDLAGATLNIIDGDLAPAGIYTILTTSTGSFTNNFGAVNAPANYGLPQVSGNIVTIEKLFVLPLVWGEFTANAVGQHVELKWQTLQESNTSHFVVERSTDGIKYTAIGNLPAKGFSSTPSSYAFTDQSPDLSASNFYRILQVDNDARSEYSAVRTVKLEGKGGYLVVQGNPIKNNMLKVNVTARGALTIVLSDVSGRVVKMQTLQPGVHSIPVSRLNAGAYQMTIMKDGIIVETKRIVKL